MVHKNSCHTARQMPQPAPDFLCGGSDLTALFPQLHVFHLFAALALKGFAHKGCVFFEAPLFAVFARGHAVAGQMTLGKNFKALATFKAGNRLFFDRLAGLNCHFATVEFDRRFPFGNGLNPCATFWIKAAISSSLITRTPACALVISSASFR